MTNPNSCKPKKKILIKATEQGVHKAEQALVRLNFDSKLDFAKSKFLARSTVTKFFNYNPIQVDSFKKICQELKLNWEEVAEISEEEQSEGLATNDCSSSNTNEGVVQVQELCRTVIVRDEQSKAIKGIITLIGDINFIENPEILQSILREHSGNSINIVDVKKGSIKLIIEGSQEDIQRLVSQIESKKLTEVNGFPIEGVQIVDKDAEDDESTKLEHKWGLVEEIVSQPVEERNLSFTDLSDADLSGACLRYANLGNADLSNADLSNADLSNADLSYVDLSDADLSRANLSRAYVNIVNLSGAQLNHVNINQIKKFCIYSDSDSDSDSEIIDKLMLVCDILNDPHCGRTLRGVDLSYTDLSYANLSGAYLSGVNLSSAYLSGAYLDGTNLSSANLSGADLSDADLSDADLSDATVKNAHFARNAGLTEDMKLNLERRGAIFDDFPGDRSPIPSGI